jgi:hypothetical protein
LAHEREYKLRAGGVLMYVARIWPESRRYERH